MPAIIGGIPIGGGIPYACCGGYPCGVIPDIMGGGGGGTAY